jgi:hypothetical protein
MRNPKYIYIIKTSRGVWQLVFAHLVIGEYPLLEDAKKFAIDYQYGEIIEVIDGENVLETIRK